MQEMAFVLLALAILGGLVLVFFIKIQSGSFTSGAEKLNQIRALSLRDKVTFLPEIKCAGASCIDKDKANILKGENNKILGDLFQGLSAVRILKIYPNEEEIIIYKSSKPIKTSYSSFANLCEQKETSKGIFDYECGLALVVVSI